MVITAKVDNMIKPNSAKERLEIIIPPLVPKNVVKFFDFMQTHIMLESNGMDVNLRETRAEIAYLMTKEGYDYSVYKNFIDDYEHQLLKQHYDEQKK